MSILQTALLRPEVIENSVAVLPDFVKAATNAGQTAVVLQRMVNVQCRFPVVGLESLRQKLFPSCGLLFLLISSVL